MLSENKFMELENLFTKLKPQEEAKDYFLALEITPHFVWAAVWQTTEEKPEVIAFGKKENWDCESLASLTSASDASLASALENLPEEPNKVIFGLPETWVSQDKIVAPRLADLKVLCQKLDLQPLGFVATTEAVIQYLKVQEGTPLSAVLAKLDPGEILLTLVQAGKNLGTQAVGRSQNLAEDINEGLARFGQKESFPSRILLYDTGEVDLEEARQNLLDFEWPASIFLHFPKVEVLAAKISITAITVAGGEEIAASLGLKKEMAAQEFGFVQGEDVMEMKKEPVKKTEQVRSKLVLPRLKLPHFKLPRWQLKLPRLKLKLGGKKRLLLLIGGALVFLLLAGGTAAALYWSVPKAEVTIFVEAKNLEKEFSAGLDPDLTSVDIEKQQIPAEVVEAEVSARESKETTGEKLIGEKAKGEITIHNFTTASKNFRAGTVVVGPDSFEFGLDADVAVASASASLDPDSWQEVITPGKTTVAISALQVGPEYNLASDSEFEIKGFSPVSYRAKNSKALSGGASRQVRVVSNQDREGLLESLTASLEEKMKEELAQKAPAGKVVLQEGILTTIADREFSQAVGAETDQLSLTMTMKAKTLAYASNDLEELLSQLIAGSIPEGFVLRELKTEIKKAEIAKEGKAVMEISLKAGLAPDLDLEQIKNNLVGKYPQVGREYLYSLPSLIKAEVLITPPLPVSLQTFPRRASNINIEIKVKE